jgi:hypothetical protein
LHFKVFRLPVGQRRSCVCKGGAADVVGQMRLKLVFFGDAGVDIAASSYMQPSQEGFHIEKEEIWGEGVSLDRASLYWYLTCADPGGKLDLGGGILIEIFDSIYGVNRETKVIHYPEHAIVVSGIES